MTSFEPQRLFIGLIDFFAILLPGALLSFLLWDWRCVVVPQSIGWQVDSGVGVAAFLFSSYVLGHFIFSFGAILLDNLVYDPLVNAAEKLDRGKRDRRSWLAAWMLPSGYTKAIDCADLIRRQDLAPLGATETTKVFQWCKARLTLDSQASLAAVERFEADSKFFRSFAVVLIALLALPFLMRTSGDICNSASSPNGVSTAFLSGPAAQPSERAVNPVLWALLFLLLLLSLWRYINQRTKATTQALLHVIAAESRRSGGYRTPPTHAGGVVYRGADSSREYLLVEASKVPNEWVLPKGHIKRGEPTEAAAIREVREETGVSARIIKPLNRINFIDGDARNVSVQFFLMESTDDTGQPAEPREHKWLALDDALREATHVESKGLLASQLN